MRSLPHSSRLPATWLLLLGCILPACSPGEEPERAAFVPAGLAAPRVGVETPSPAGPTDSLGRPIRSRTSGDDLIAFGITPWQAGASEDEFRRLFRPMLEWMGERTGKRFVAVSATSYDAMIALVAEGKVQLALLAPVAYVRAREQESDLTLMATCLTWDEVGTERRDTFRGHVLCLRTRTDLRGLEDLEGLRFGYVDRASSSGYLLPRRFLEASTHHPDRFFGKSYFLGSHSRVTDAIAAGSIDAGATWFYNWSSAVEHHGYLFKSLLETDPIPNPCIVAHPSVDPELRRGIERALFELPLEHLDGLPIAGFVRRKDSFYDPVRHWLAPEAEGER